MARSFAVIGLGTFGAQAARELFLGGADVLAIDTDPEVVQQIADSVTKAACADAMDIDALEALGVLETDVVIVALRRRFDTSVLIVHRLRREGVREIIALVDNEEKASALEAIGATMVIFPERDIARRVGRQLLMPDLADQIPLGKGFGIIEVPAPRSFAKKSLIELDIRKNHRITVIAIKKHAKSPKKDPVWEVSPAPDTQLQDDDTLVVLGSTNNLAAFREFVERTNGE